MMMKWCHRRTGFLVLAGSVLLTLILALFPQRASAQVTPLNNLVARVDQPRGPIPAECEQGLSPAQPLRVEVRDIELPVDEPDEPVAPPSGALRAALQQTQIALTSNDRPAFNAALARARALLSTYPTGGERRTAEDIVRLHETAARLWDTQYEAPFFGETDPEYALVSGLPGFAEAVRRSTLTDDKERRFYPTAESRDFVADLAGERLQRLGIHRNTPSIRDDRNQRPRSTPSRASSSSTETTPRRSASSTTPRRSSTSASPRQSSTSEVPRQSSRSESPRRSATASSSGRSSASSSSSSLRRDPAPAPRPAAATTAPRPSTSTPPPAVATTPTPAPVTSSPAGTATETTAPSTESATGTPTTDVPIDTDPDATATGTDATADAATTTTIDTAVTSTAVVPAVPSTSPGRSVILPTILILIGLGVLIVLFRASK